MKTINKATTRELEIAQVKLAIARTEESISSALLSLSSMHRKQIARHLEVVRQENFALRAGAPDGPEALRAKSP